MTILVSAIVSVYKGEKFIRGCLQDLLEQTLYNKNALEIIVVNSNSPEREEGIICEFRKNFDRVQYIKTPERETLYEAWNRGISAAQGEFVTNANVDDRHRSDGLEKLLDSLLFNPHLHLAYGDVFRTYQANDSFIEGRQFDRFTYNDFFPPEVLLSYQFGCQPLWRKSIHAEIGYFNSEFRAAGDWEFNFRFNLAGKKAVRLPEVLGLFYENPDSLSLQHGQSVSEQQRLREQFGSIQIVLQLYEKAGWSVVTKHEQVSALLDFARRAAAFRLPWEPGKVYSDTGFANLLLEAAKNIQAVSGEG